MASEPKPLTFDEFADEIIAETQPRALVILACAKIDIQLVEILGCYLLPKSAKNADQDELLEGDNPLATFSSRIKLCTRLGLIDKEFAAVLDKLRDIRNKAAHWVRFGIRESPLRDKLKHLQSLVEARRSYRLTTKRFFGDEPLSPDDKLKVCLLTVSVILESVKTKLASAGSPVSPPAKID